MQIEHELPPQRRGPLAEESDEQPARQERQCPDGKQFHRADAMDPGLPTPPEAVRQCRDEGSNELGVVEKTIELASAEMIRRRTGTSVPRPAAA